MRSLRRLAPGLRLTPPAGGRIGDPGLFGPGSMVWRIARERALLAGGPAALLMQIAHPLVAAGVDEHSDFRRDPLARLSATLGPTMTVTFGDRDQALAAAQAVARTHRLVRGTLREDVGTHPAGTPYSATDPDLALWVHATLMVAATSTYRLLVGPLSDEERARHHEEGKTFAELFGVRRGDVPAGYEDFQAYVQDMVGGTSLTVNDRARRLAAGVLRPAFSAPVRPAVRLTAVLTAGILPERLRRDFRLPWGAGERAAFGMGVSSLRRALPLLPAQVRFWPHYQAAMRRSMGIETRITAFQ